MATNSLCKKRYVIYMTEEQKEVISGIFTFHGWDIEIFEDNEVDICANKQVKDKCVDADQSKDTTCSGKTLDIRSGSSCSAVLNEPTEISQTDVSDNSKCPHCLNSPCVTLIPQSWLGNGQLPRPGNNLIRKKLYRKYWTMLDRRGLWSNPLYLQRKQRLMQEAHFELTVREIMPDNAWTS